MQKIFTSIDSVLTEIGRIVLLRPLLFGILFVSAIVITICNNNKEEEISTQPANHLAFPTVVSVAMPTLATLAVPMATASATAPATVTEPVRTPLATDKVAAEKEVVVTSTKTVATAKSVSGLHYASGRISRSLAADARKAGLSSKQASQLVRMFSSKNLAQKVHVGDEFRVLYENSTKATGSKKSTSNILAAQLVIKGKTYQLLRFTDPKGHTEYYNPQGQSLHEGILRVPPRFGRVTSGFSGDRLDPVLGFHRPHLGVDFAGPQGAPVQAAGDGVLAEMGYRGGYGKVVVIQHDSKYSTVYAHLSRFAAGVRGGKKIHKGQTIGYVGQTGFATGPHLHYEIRINDVAFNPMTVALPGTSIPAAYRSQFLSQSRILIAQLNIHGKRQLQLAEQGEAAKRS